MDSSGHEGRWLALVTILPTDDPASRMLILRTLESLGSAVLREGVYLLPDNASNRQSLIRLSEHVARLHGTCHLLFVAEQDKAQHLHFLNLFDRTKQYEELIKSVQGLKAAFGISDPGSISRVLGKLRRDFEAISALDFFPSLPREQAKLAMTVAEKEIHALLFPDGQDTVSREDIGPQYLGRTWATRPPLWTDRLASAWLIRRFIDVKATLLWLNKSDKCPSTAIGFGYEGAAYSNSNSQVTFEILLESFGLQKDTSLARIGALIRNIEGTGPAIPEATGVETLLEGARRRSTSEDNVLFESEKTFDLLYDAYSDSNQKI